MKAAIYYRVSTEDQEREGTSLQTQLEACEKRCQDMCYEVTCRLGEAYSGLALERPKLDELRELVRNEQIDVIVVYCLDRLSRDPTHGVILIQELEKHRVKLESVSEDVDNSELGKLISYIRGFASKLEAEKIRERTIRGKRAKAKQGKIPSGSHARLYGYDYIPVREENGGRRAINEDEAAWARRMFEWLVEDGLSVCAITKRLRTLGVPTPSGRGYWIKSTVAKMLKNTAYIGKTYAFTVTYGEPKTRMKPDTKRKNSGAIARPRDEWIEMPKATPPIISEKLFEAAQNKLNQNRKFAVRNTRHEYLLHGLVRCRSCGRGYWGYVSVKHRGEKRYEARRYRCSGTQSIVTPVKCSNCSYNAQKLESLVWTQVEDILSHPEVVIAEIERRQEEASRLGSLEIELDIVKRRLAELDKEQQQLLDWALKGFPEETVDKTNKRINETRCELIETRTKLEEQVEITQKQQVNIDKIEYFCDLVKSNIKLLTYENKRLALEALDIKVWIDGKSIEITGVIPVLKRAITSMPSGWRPPGRHPGSLYAACHRAGGLI